MILNKEERLIIYKQMLQHYLSSYLYGRKKFHTESGFCHYIDENLDNPSEDNYYYLTNFPELYEQNPKKSIVSGYWFKPGRLYPRIRCIKKAIKLCENARD